MSNKRLVAISEEQAEVFRQHAARNDDEGHEFWADFYDELAAAYDSGITVEEADVLAYETLLSEMSPRWELFGSAVAKLRVLIESAPERSPDHAS